MNRPYLLLFLVFVVVLPVRAASVEDELKALNQQLIDAVARGDRSVMDRIYAPTFVRTTVDGRLLTKAEIMKPNAGPKPGVVTKYESQDVRVFTYGDSAVLAYLSIRDVDDNGSHSYLRYRVTDTFAKVDGRWQKVASAGTPVTAEAPSK